MSAGDMANRPKSNGLGINARPQDPARGSSRDGSNGALASPPLQGHRSGGWRPASPARQQATSPLSPYYTLPNSRGGTPLADRLLSPAGGLASRPGAFGSSRGSPQSFGLSSLSISSFREPSSGFRESPSGHGGLSHPHTPTHAQQRAAHPSPFHPPTPSHRGASTLSRPLPERGSDPSEPPGGGRDATTSSSSGRAYGQPFRSLHSAQNSLRGALSLVPGNHFAPQRQQPPGDEPSPPTSAYGAHRIGAGAGSGGGAGAPAGDMKERGLSPRPPSADHRNRPPSARRLQTGVPKKNGWVAEQPWAVPSTAPTGTLGRRSRAGGATPRSLWDPITPRSQTSEH